LIERSNISEARITLLESSMDGFLFANGFSRREKSHVYIRSKDGAKQKIDLTMQLSPSYENGALAHVIPYYSILFKDVDKVFKDMVQGMFEYSIVVASKDSFTIHQQIQVGYKAEHEYWFIKSDTNILDLGAKIRTFIENHTLPFLNDYMSVEDLISGYEHQDKRVIMIDYYHVQIASAYVVVGNYEKGMAVLEKRFGNKGKRDKYKTAFDYINRML